MTVAEIIEFIRNVKKPTGSMIDDNTLLSYINIIYPKVHKKVIDLDKNYYRTRRTENLIQGKNTYALLKPNSATGVFGQGTIEKVGIKYREKDEGYTSATLSSFDRLSKDTSWYQKNAHEHEPIALFASGNIKIYPTPKQTIAGGLKFEGSKKPYKLSLSSDEDDILVPMEYHDIIARGVIPFVYHEREMIGEKNDAVNEYERRLREMQEDLMNVTTTYVVKHKQDLSEYN